MRRKKIFVRAELVGYKHMWSTSFYHVATSSYKASSESPRSFPLAYNQVVTHYRTESCKMQNVQNKINKGQYCSSLTYSSLRVYQK